LHDEKLPDLYCTLDIIRGMYRACGTYGGGVGHVAHIGEKHGMWDMGGGGDTFASGVWGGKGGGRGPLGNQKNILGG